MGDRYTYSANLDVRNSNIYPFVVLDTEGPRPPVAYTVTMHTAREFVRQLNENGYIEAI